MRKAATTALLALSAGFLVLFVGDGGRIRCKDNRVRSIDDRSIPHFDRAVRIGFRRHLPRDGASYLLFVSENFGMRHLGSLSGLITLVHHMSGAAGAYLGSAAFDSGGSYDVVFPIMLGSSVVALVLTLPLRRSPRERRVSRTL